MEGELILDNELSLVERKLKSLRKRPKDKKSQATRVTNHLNEAFDLIGGVPRLAIWANNPENQGDFYKMYARSGQKLDVAHSGEITIRPALPKSPLDD